MLFESGHTLSHYRIERQIGKGGMGTVFLAEDTKLGRKVALKVLPPAMSSDKDRLARFQREAKAVAALNHPNIVTLYSVEEEDGVHFITMELVEGQTLAELLPRNGFSLDRLLAIAIPLADAVSRAHRAGITHRDLKPDNIMIDSDGRLRVLDFGLAKLHDPLGSPGDTQVETAAAITEEGKILGTVAYMSPEQAEGKNIDSRSDIFSLGTILYEMASGERPFRGETSMSTIGAILKDQPTPITELNRALPRHVGRIIHRCLAKDPDRRCQTALDLRNELEELKTEIDSGTHDAESPGAAGRTAPGSRREPIPAWQMALAGLGMVGVLAAGYFLWPRNSERPTGPATIRPLTSMAGVEGGATWSPDGTFLAFGHSPTGNLFVTPTAGGDPVPLTDGDAGDHSPRWSPDSRWIAFASNRDGRTGVFLVPPLGGRVQRLADTHGLYLYTELGSLGGIPWSPDARTLLFSRQASDGSVAIWEIELDSRRETQLTHPEPGIQDLNASWSFDGSRIVFSRDGHLWLLAPSGAPQPLLAGESVEGVGPVWMPDGDHILFTSEQSGNPDLWEINATSGSLRQITSSPGADLAPAVSRDGRIAYTDFSHEQDLYVVSLADRSHKRLTSHTRWNQNARIAPDGTKIVYDSLRTGDWEVWVIDRATGSETRLASHPAADSSPSWSPDGKQVAFLSERDGESALWVVNADGSGGPRRVTGETVRFTDISTVRWSPDGAAIGFLVYSERGPALHELDIATGDVTVRIYGVETFGWYLDRERVIYTPITGDSDGRVEMRVANLRTGKEEVLLAGLHTDLIVARDGSGVAYCRAASHAMMQLYYLKLHPPSPASVDGLPTPDGQPVQLTDGYGEYHVHNGGWSPDGREIVYTRDIDGGDIYVIETR